MSISDVMAPLILWSFFALFILFARIKGDEKSMREKEMLNRNLRISPTILQSDQNNGIALQSYTESLKSQEYRIFKIHLANN